MAGIIAVATGPVDLRSIDRRAAKKAIAPHAIAYCWTATVRRVRIPDAASCLLRRKTTEEAGKTARDSPYRFAWKSL
jgi:hypothetical protein